MSRIPVAQEDRPAITIATQAALGVGLRRADGRRRAARSSAAARLRGRAVERPGQGRADGVDPNSVSAEPVRAMNRQLRAKTRQLAARGSSTKRGIAREHGTDAGAASRRSCT